MATRKKNSKDHAARKNSGSAEFFKIQRKERNAERPKQIIVATVLQDETGLAKIEHVTRVRD